MVSVWPPKARARKIVYGFAFVLLCVVSMFLTVGQSKEAEKKQTQIQDKADRQEKELRGKLDQSLLSQEYMRGQLDSIGLMIGKLGEAKNNPDLKQLATAVAKMADNVSWKPPHIIPVTAPNQGNFQIAHKLGCSPISAVIQMTSFGMIVWQAENKMFDKTNLYLLASDTGLAAQALVWRER
jgi:hypothetical protein